LTTRDCIIPGITHELYNMIINSTASYIKSDLPKYLGNCFQLYHPVIRD